MTATAKRRGRPAKPRLDFGGQATILRRANLHEHAFETLRGLIVKGVLAPDTMLVEADLCARLGVSRTPLREALKLLAAQRLVELRPHRGARVTPLQASEMIDLFETLAGLERTAAHLAARRMTAAQLDALSTQHDVMEELFAQGRLDDYFAVNHAIHACIVACAGNAVLTETHRWLLARAERARLLALRSRSRWVESIEEHRLILAALRARDAARAGDLLAAHVAHTGAEVARFLEGSLKGIAA